MVRKISLIVLSLILVGIIALVSVSVLTKKDTTTGGPTTDSTQDDDTKDDDGKGDDGKGDDGKGDDGKGDDGKGDDGKGDGGKDDGTHVCKYKFVEKVEPTCASKGYDLYVCTICSKEQLRNTQPATGKHDYIEVSHKATCKADFYTAYECKVCKAVKEGSIVTVEGTKRDHEYEWTETKKATCKETGSKDGACIWCGTTTTETIPAEKHSFGEYISNDDATCLKDGTKTASCTVCGTESTVYDEGTKLGHFCKDEDYKSNNDATCITAGTLSGTCERCGATVTKAGETDPNAHAYGKFDVIDGTCGQEGTISYQCVYCNNSFTKKEVITHSYSSSSLCVRCGRDMARLHITENTSECNDFLKPYVYIDVSSISSRGDSITFTVEIVMETVNGFTPESISSLYFQTIHDVSGGISGNVHLRGSLWNYNAKVYVLFNFEIKFNYSTSNDYVEFYVSGSGSHATHKYQCDTGVRIYVGDNKDSNHTHIYGDWIICIGTCKEESRFEKRCLACSNKNVKNIGYEAHDFKNGSKCSVCGKGAEIKKARFRIDIVTPDEKPVSDFGLVYLEIEIKSLQYKGNTSSDRIEENYVVNFEMLIYQYYIDEDGEFARNRIQATQTPDRLGWSGSLSFRLMNVFDGSFVEFRGIIDGTADKEGDKLTLHFPVFEIYDGNHNYDGHIEVFLAHEDPKQQEQN